MPGRTETITITKLHPTFGAEISGVNFSQPLSEDVLQELKSASAKVFLITAMS